MRWLILADLDNGGVLTAVSRFIKGLPRTDAFVFSCAMNLDTAAGIRWPVPGITEPEVALVPTVPQASDRVLVALSRESPTLLNSGIFNNIVLITEDIALQEEFIDIFGTKEVENKNIHTWYSVDFERRFFNRDISHAKPIHPVGNGHIFLTDSGNVSSINQNPPDLPLLADLNAWSVYLMGNHFVFSQISVTINTVRGVARLNTTQLSHVDVSDGVYIQGTDFHPAIFHAVRRSSIGPGTVYLSGGTPGSSGSILASTKLPFDIIKADIGRCRIFADRDRIDDLHILTRPYQRACFNRRYPVWIDRNCAIIHSYEVWWFSQSDGAHSNIKFNNASVRLGGHTIKIIGRKDYYADIAIHEKEVRMVAAVPDDGLDIKLGISLRAYQLYCIVHEQNRIAVVSDQDIPAGTTIRLVPLQTRPDWVARASLGLRRLPVAVPLKENYLSDSEGLGVQQARGEP